MAPKRQPGEKQLNRWNEDYQTSICGLQSRNPDTRFASIITLINNLSAVSLGSSLADDRDGFVSTLCSVIGHPFSDSEHKEALALVCNLSLQLFTGFDRFATVFVQQFLPTLSDLPANQQFRLYAVGFVAGFSLVAEDARQRVVQQYCELLTNRRSRGAPFTSGMIIECLRGLNLMVSLCASTVSACDCYSEIAGVLDRMLGVKDPKVLAEALNLLLLLHESIAEVETLTESGCRLQMSRIQFIGAYGGKLAQIPGLAPKKADKRALSKQCALVARIFEGEEGSVDDIVLNNQSVEIVGRKRQTVVAAVRRVTKAHFQEQMATNQIIHQFLGITLMTQQRALGMKRKFKDRIESDCAMKKRAREQAIAKKRKQKEDRTDVKEGN
jgi:hypothetical protein